MLKVLVTLSLEICGCILQVNTEYQDYFEGTKVSYVASEVNWEGVRALNHTFLGAPNFFN